MSALRQEEVKRGDYLRDRSGVCEVLNDWETGDMGTCVLVKRVTGALAGNQRPLYTDDLANFTSLSKEEAFQLQLEA